MRQYTLTKEIVDQIAYTLGEADYKRYEKPQYIRYSIEHGNSVFIHHQLHIIRATKNTKGSNIIFNFFGAPNGKSHKGEDHRLDSWFFNGYSGKVDDHEFTEKKNSFQYAEEIAEDDDQEFSEGTKQRITVNKYERDPKARAECIRIHGHSCQVCEFDFEKVYGELGREYIHVHHLKPLKEIGEKYTVDPEKYLIPVCPNCHAMLHRLDDPSDVGGLRERLNK